MHMGDRSAEILRSAVAWALYLADEQEDTLAAALLAQVLDLLTVGSPKG
jgi:hypothetical protein